MMTKGQSCKTCRFWKEWLVKRVYEDRMGGCEKQNQVTMDTDGKLCWMYDKRKQVDQKEEHIKSKEKLT